MVDEAVHDFRPFVHSDCGAGETSGTAVMRWTAHCVLGTILRYHGADHSPWQFDNATQTVIRKYDHHTLLRLQRLKKLELLFAHKCRSSVLLVLDMNA
jgi:hypothetical protein